MTNDTRPSPPLTGGERDQLDGFLDFHRATVHRKALGLSEEDAHRSLLPSALMTVAGLVSHLRWVEAYWFEVVLLGQPDQAPYSDANPDGEFEIAATTTMDELLDQYARQCERSREIAAKIDLDAEVPFRQDRRVNLRWVLIHMVEETGRHAGHLDILRELLDGTTGT